MLNKILYFFILNLFFILIIIILNFKNNFLFALLIFLFIFQLILFYLFYKKYFIPIKDIKSSIGDFLRTHTLEKIIPQNTEKDLNFIISNLNRMMLELQAFKSFHIDQVVDERNKSNALMNTIKDAILLIDSSGEIIHYNNKAFALLEMKSDINTFSINDIKNIFFFNNIKKIINSNENASNLENLYEEKKKTYLFSFSKFKIPSIKKDGIIIVIKDITIEKEIERTKEDFFHMITHDMRSPLSTIKGYLEIIFSKLPIDDNLSKYIKNIKYSISKLAGFIDDILNTTKLENKNMPIKYNEIKVKDFLLNIIENEKIIGDLKGIDIKLEENFKDDVLFADEKLLERVIINIIGNAIKFTPQKGEIILGLNSNKDYLTLYIKDTGPGIPKDKLEDIFKKYVQMDEHRDMGFGLGLNMSKMAIEAHKGKIYIESELGKGAKFIIELPKNG